MKHLVLGLILATSSIAFADTMAIPVAKQGEQDTKVPRHGQKMDAVEAEFGEPATKKPAVGEPPISQWVYGEFTVYFEHDVVIHTVMHPAKK